MGDFISEFRIMLKRLYISNFALIEEMDVSFPGKLSVITGETGAGKSIFLEALALVLGKRADAASLSNKAKKCIIEAEFDVKQLDLRDFFADNEVDPSPELILRREISAEGKSRSFLNDSVVSLSALKELSEKIIDIHSQHQTLLLNQGTFQMELLDAFSGNQSLLADYKQAFNQLTKTKKQLQELQAQAAEAKKQLDYHQFLFQELEELNLQSGDLQTLEQESASLENAELIQTQLLQAAAILQEGDNNLLQQLQRIKQSVNDLTRFNSAYKDLADRLTAGYVELKDIAKELDAEGNAVSGDNERLSLVNERLDKINHLLRKHNVREETELLAIQQNLSAKLENIGSLEDQLDKLQKQIKEQESSVKTHGMALSKRRNKNAEALEKEVVALLKELSMENANFKVELGVLDAAGNNGLDTIKFLFSANKGVVLNDMSKIASGGELSRVMLSLKAIMADKKQLPTIIFDEIDTGVSGDVANKIGDILQRMSMSLQIITITHLPQMASKGKHHLFVYKDSAGDQTVSHIKALSNDERIVEIAKMLSTSNPTASAMKNAKDLLSL